MSITEDQAEKALRAALEKARSLGSPSSIAILDGGRNLLAYHRMEGAPLASIEISQAKAYTAVSVNMNTADITEYVQPGGPFYGLETSHRHPLVVFGGGIVVRDNGRLIGAIGVAGGPIDQDVAIATAAATAIVA